MLPPAASTLLRAAAGRNIAKDTTQRIGVVDVLPIDAENDIVDLEPDLASGRVVIDEGDQGSPHVLQPQLIH